MIKYKRRNVLFFLNERMAERRFVQLDDKNEERMNAIRKFTQMDDSFMTLVFSGDK